MARQSKFQIQARRESILTASYSLRLPADLLAAVDERCRAEGRSREEFTRAALVDRLEGPVKKREES